MNWLFFIVVVATCASTLARGLWRLQPFYAAVYGKLPRIVLQQTLLTAAVGVCLQLPTAGWFAMVLVVLLLQPMLLLLLWPLQLFANRVQRCDPLREKM